MPRGRPSETHVLTFTLKRVCTKATHSLLAEDDNVADNAMDRLPTEL